MMDRDDLYDHSVRIYTSIAQKAKEYGYDKDTTGVLNHYIQAALLDTSHPFGLHGSMFVPTIASQGTEAQKAEYLPKAERYEIIGTYVQTEIGHGTFLRGLETTAVYDQVADQFVIHSPTVSSIKYWPGGLGKTTNYAVVMAQLVIDGEQHGMHAFICQLRNLDTHQPLAGIELGDINRKFGYDNMDNGYLRFNNYRIPRTNMLMRYTQVSTDGEYTRQKLPQIAYITMVQLRMLITLGCGNDLAMAATIATRYSAVRRQTTNSQGIEPQILDYQTQQMKLFPSISTAYAVIFTGLAVRNIYTEIYNSVQAEDISRLAEIHMLTSGMKAYASEVCTAMIEVCRRSCGGHGYSHASGIPKIYERCVPACTYEGENTVMYLQCARSLLKFYGKAQAGEELPGMIGFLKDSADIPVHFKSAKVFNFEFYLKAYRLNALMMLKNVANAMQKCVYKQSTDPEIAWNRSSQALVETAKAYALYLTVVLFMDHLRTDGWEPCAKAVMAEVCEFYAVNNILENSGSFLQNGVLSPEQVEAIATRRVELLAVLRPNAVSLVDAFDYPDRLLNSCLGRYDGNVYEALYEYAKSSSLNKQQVHPSFQKYIKPMRKALKSML
ncbi:peroxisomal acyl-coenzyme A oxidase 1-like isoform X2 [Watersipora subatra]